MDEQRLLETLNTYTNEVQKFLESCADQTDRQLDAVFNSIRGSLEDAAWLPASARPLPRSPPPRAYVVPQSCFQRMQDWVSRHRSLTAAIFAFLGTSGLMIYYQKSYYGRRRKAKRAQNGARKEVVVIAGTPSSPITKSLALDLDRRGFHVYVVANSEEDERTIANDIRLPHDTNSYIKSLPLMIADPQATREAIERFTSSIRRRQAGQPAPQSNGLTFKGLIVVPDLTYPSGSAESVSLDSWSDSLNVKVLGSVATIQAFLPLVRKSKSRVLVLTPSIISALGLPSHGVESAVVGALTGYAASLRSELQPLGIAVSQLRLGTFDFSKANSGKHADKRAGSPAQLTWLEQPADTKAVTTRHNILNTVSGSDPQVLHHAVFDALTHRRPRPVWRVGRGSLTYDFVGAYLPASAISWMLGLHQPTPERAATTPPVDHVTESQTMGTSWEKVAGAP